MWSLPGNSQYQVKSKSRTLTVFQCDSVCLYCHLFCVRCEIAHVCVWSPVVSLCYQKARFVLTRSDLQIPPLLCHGERMSLWEGSKHPGKERCRLWEGLCLGFHSHARRSVNRHSSHFYKYLDGRGCCISVERGVSAIL